jgi:hypothetical protein
VALRPRLSSAHIRPPCASGARLSRPRAPRAAGAGPPRARVACVQSRGAHRSHPVRRRPPRRTGPPRRAEPRAAGAPLRPPGSYRSPAQRPRLPPPQTSPSPSTSPTALPGRDRGLDTERALAPVRSRTVENELTRRPRPRAAGFSSRIIFARMKSCSGRIGCESSRRGFSSSARPAGLADLPPPCAPPGRLGKRGDKLSSSSCVAPT